MSLSAQINASRPLRIYPSNPGFSNNSIYASLAFPMDVNKLEKMPSPMNDLELLLMDDEVNQFFDDLAHSNLESAFKANLRGTPESNFGETVLSGCVSIEDITKFAVDFYNDKNYRGSSVIDKLVANLSSWVCKGAKEVYLDGYQVQ